MTTKQKCKQLARFFKVRLRFVYLKNRGGYCYFNEDTILIDKRTKATKLVSIFCHELMHIINHYEGNYPLYHGTFKEWVNCTKKEKLGILKTAYKAEVYTDKKGNELRKIFFPNEKYKYYYNGSKKSRKTCLDNLKSFVYFNI